MTKQTSATLKGYFDTGDVPTAAQFANLIDSFTPSAATLVVAASDATAAHQANADYVCDGTNDEVQIQAAIDALPAAGGRVLLTEGTFNLYTAGSVTGDHNEKWYCVRISHSHGAVMIEGMGSTYLRLADNQHHTTYMLYIRGMAATPRTNPTYIRGLHLDYNGANQPARNDLGDYNPQIAVNYAGKTVIEACRFTGATFFSIQFCYISPKNVVRDCYFTGQGGIRSESYNLMCVNNVFDILTTGTGEQGFGVSLAPDSDDYVSPGVPYLNFGCIVHGNLFIGGRYQMHMNSPQGNIITNNVFTDLPSGYSIYIRPGGEGEGGEYNVITGNTFYNVANGMWLYGVSTYGLSNNVIAGNIMFPGVDRALDKGIYFQDGDSANNVIVGNVLATNGAKITSLGSDIIRLNVGYITEKHGAAANTADGGTIAHGLATTPTRANVTASVAGEIVSVTAVSATTITVAIKKADGSAGTTQTIYWEAQV